ncbi:hypothetical protein KY334_01410 [Candidatus Woesearchaeota archaeon]|nr:hypothetical protein [Candidatus Woesearchaeota archaeon]
MLKNKNSIWQLHEKAVDIAENAFIEESKGNLDKAIKLFEKALVLELDAISKLKPNNEPTRSILYRSATSLAFKAKQFSKAILLIEEGLNENVPIEIRKEFEDLKSEVCYHESFLHLKWVN